MLAWQVANHEASPRIAAMKKKKVLILGSSAVIIIAGLGFGGQAWLKGRLQRDALVAQMEEVWNCRAHLDRTSVSLFSSPAKASLHGLRLAPRDDQALLPLAQRSPLEDSAVLLSCDTAILSVQFADLLAGRVNVEQLQLDTVKARVVVDESGKSSLDSLFESPYEEPAPEAVTGGGGGAVAEAAPAAAAQPAPAPDAGATPAEPAKIDEPKKPEQPTPEQKPMRADAMLFSLAVKEAGVTNAQVDVTDQKNGTHMNLEQVRFTLKDIDVDPDDLARHNHCLFEFGANIKVEKPSEKAQMADFVVEGSGDMEPFDAKTGVWQPDLNLAVAIKKGGLIGGTLLANQMGKKDAERLKEYGLELGDIAIGGLLQEDATTKVHVFGEGKIMLKQDTRLTFPQYEIAVLDKSWFNPRQDAHIVRARLVVGPELTGRIVEGAKKSLAGKYGESIGELAVSVVGSTLMDSEKRLVLPFKAKGPMSKPDVQLDTVLNDIKDLLKDAGKNLLEGLFK
jgi:hypothetical protein